VILAGIGNDTGHELWLCVGVSRRSYWVETGKLREFLPVVVLESGNYLR